MPTLSRHLIRLNNMMKLPYPDIALENIFELSPELLKEAGISFLLLDLDNTIAPYSRNSPTVAELNWVDSIKRTGIEPFILSNNHGDRPKIFAEALSIDFINKAKKPSTKRLFEVLEDKGVSPENVAIVGDQVYTDIACGKRAGIMTILLKPIELKNPLLLGRYWLERPFRPRRRKK